MKRILFTVEEYDGANNAGPKAKEDIEKILHKDGFEIVSKHINIHSKISKLNAYLFTIPRIFSKNQFVDEIYFQYPTYSTFVMKRLIKTLKKHCNKFIFIIHDIESLRLFVNDDDYWASESQLLNEADALIVHNDQMNFQPDTDLNFTKSVCFAGNLSKAEFLNDLSLNHVTLTVYGPHATGNYHHGVKYDGQYSPDELPSHLTQNFGLVWDGTSSQTCNGKFGNYMKYNNPHKVSLYLSCGIPVVIWKQAALASFIVNNGLGIAVDSLAEMDQVISQLSEKEYATYKQNALQISEQLRSGYYTLKAITKVQRELQ